MNKGENNLSFYDNEDKRKEETVYACDSKTVNEHAFYFSISDFGKNVCQSTYK